MRKRLSINDDVLDEARAVAERTKKTISGRIRSWLEQPCVRVVHATGRHLEVFRDLLVAGQATANLVPDAHLAALAIEHGCLLCSTDGDFARFPGLAWKNPLA